MRRGIACLKERRKYRRIQKSFGVNIVAVGKKATLPKLDHEVGLNISLGGMLIQCEHMLKKGTPLSIKLMLVKDGVYKSINAKGRVIWQQQSFEKKNTYFLGIKFDRIQPLEQEKIVWFST